jgi:hypothetical protein
MPVAPRVMTEEEHDVFAALCEVELRVQSGPWRFRQSLKVELERQRRERPRDPVTITRGQAELLRAVAWEQRKKMPFDVEAFSRSPIGAFPYTKKERPVPGERG